MPDMEKRFISELRFDGKAAPRRLTGFAARYGAIADLGAFRERIAPGAFSQSIGQDKDVLALFDHDPTKVLGRTRARTLSLQDTDDGLRFDVEVPDTSAGRDALALAERGDLGGASIGFIVQEESRDGQVRVIERANLMEISIVSAWPAYAETSVEARRNGDCSLLPQKPRLAQLQRFLETL